MTNFEKIKAMTVEEMAWFFVDQICIDCMTCKLFSGDYLKQSFSCEFKLAQWLKREVEKKNDEL